jgi:hypothetical protein
MEDHSDDNHDQDEELNTSEENELRKLKMSAEKGAVFGGSGNLPPEIEKAWLDQIENFDKSWENAKQTTLFKFLGEPDFKLVAEISKKQLPGELKRITRLMKKNGIELDTVCDYGDAVIYQFITEELFLAEVDDIRVPGMTNHFIYEEFYPNHEHDIKRLISDFFDTLFGGDAWEYLSVNLSEEVDCDGSGQMIGKNEVIEKLKLYRAAFDNVELSDAKQLEHQNVIIKEGKATSTFDISYSATIQGSYESIKNRGIAKFSLTKEEEYWEINGFVVPGVLSAI